MDHGFPAQLVFTHWFAVWQAGVVHAPATSHVSVRHVLHAALGFCSAQKVVLQTLVQAPPPPHEHAANAWSAAASAPAVSQQVKHES
jgi:hypothetical protein